MWDLKFWWRHPACSRWLLGSAYSNSPPGGSIAWAKLEILWSLPALEQSLASSTLCRVLSSCRSMGLLRKCDLCLPYGWRWPWKNSLLLTVVDSSLWASTSSLSTSKEIFHWVSLPWSDRLGHVCSCDLYILRSMGLRWLMREFPSISICRGLILLLHFGLGCFSQLQICWLSRYSLPLELCLCPWIGRQMR